MLAAQNGHNEAVKILVQHGAGVDIQDVVSTLYSDILLYTIIRMTDKTFSVHVYNNTVF